MYPETGQKELRHLDLVYSRWIFLTLSKFLRLGLYNPYRAFYVMEERLRTGWLKIKCGPRRNLNPCPLSEATDLTPLSQNDITRISGSMYNSIYVSFSHFARKIEKSLCLNSSNIDNLSTELDGWTEPKRHYANIRECVQ